jgi:hypothetical protein
LKINYQLRIKPNCNFLCRPVLSSEKLRKVLTEII